MVLAAPPVAPVEVNCEVCTWGRVAFIAAGCDTDCVRAAGGEVIQCGGDGVVVRHSLYLGRDWDRLLTRQNSAD